MGEPSLSEVHRTDADLSLHPWAGQHIQESTFEVCDLTGIRATAGQWHHVVLDRCAATGADFAGLTTRDCSILGTALDRSRLTGSSWLRSRWRQLEAADVQAEGLSAVDSTWENLTLRGWNLQESDFSGATWRRVHLIDCDLSNARFSGLRCSQVRMTDCSLLGVTGIESLRGAALGHTDALSAVAPMAAHLGIRIDDESRRS